MFVDEGVLFRQQYNDTCQIIVPPSLHAQLFKLFHTSLPEGHLGVQRTTAKILETRYWPGTRRIVAQLVRQCVDCEKCKEAKEDTKANLQPIVTTRRWQMLVIDFLGPLTETSLRNKYILTIIDHFTKYAIA